LPSRAAALTLAACVNLILFEAAELDQPLPRRDRRAVHLVEILQRGVGDTFDAGVIDGARGKGTVTTLSASSLGFTFHATTPASPAALLTVILGLPRPQTARDVLRDATTLGVAALHFAMTEKTDPGYAQSRLWSTGEWRRHLIAGAEQAFDPRLPTVSWGRPLAEAVASLPPGDVRLALDNYEAPLPLGQCTLAREARVALAIGGERGWSARERDLLRAQGFQFHHLGSRVLRTETACTAALTLVRAKLGLM
jgi:RsmE family RNA methyltransferase